MPPIQNEVDIPLLRVGLAGEAIEPGQISGLREEKLVEAGRLALELDGAHAKFAIPCPVVFKLLGELGPIVDRPSAAGRTAQQADQDFAAMDTNGDGSISNAEMLSGMSQTSNSNDPLAESLRQMMDTNHDGTVSGTEYVNLESALVYAAR